MITLQGGPADGRAVSKATAEPVMRIPTSVDLQGAIMTSPVDADALYTDEGVYLGLEFLPRILDMVLPPSWAAFLAEEPEPAAT